MNSQNLHDLAPLLWGTRTNLLIVVLAHIYGTIRLSIENRRRVLELLGAKHRESQLRVASHVAEWRHSSHLPSRHDLTGLERS